MIPQISNMPKQRWTWISIYLISLAIMLSMDGAQSFQATPCLKQQPMATSTALFMGKLRSKQADLQRKMVEAKQQAQARKVEEGNNGRGVTSASSAATTATAAAATSTKRLTDEEIKERNDRKRFEELLASSTVSMMKDGMGEDGIGSYLSQEQEEENIDAYNRGVDRFFEGDTAPVQVFEELVSIKSENAIGETGSKRLLPWLRGKDDCVVVISDPRQKSPEFRDTVKELQRSLPKATLRKTVFVNADTPAENRRWLKKAGLMSNGVDGDQGGGVTLYSDEKMEWMRAYTALGETKWSMTLFVLADERIQKLVREMSSVSAASVVENAVKAAEKRRL